MPAAHAPTDTWVRRFHPAPEAATTLVCLPHAGGSASYFHPLSAAFSPGVEVLCVQYPGRQDRRTERCVDDLYELAELTAAALRDRLAGLGRPFALFGHSLGATLGFEVARLLAADGISPLALFASGRRAPSAFRDERVHQLSDDLLVADLKRLSGTNTEMLEDEEVREMVLPAVRGDYKAAETYRYRPGPPLSCPIVALTGDDDPQVSLEEARAWSEHTDAAFELIVYPGGHFYLEPQAAAVRRDLLARIAAFS